MAIIFTALLCKLFCLIKLVIVLKTTYVDGAYWANICSAYTGTYYEDHCYYLGRGRVDYNRANEICYYKFSYLTIIDSAEENKVIVNWYKRHVNHTGVWTGYRYNTSIEAWQWTATLETSQYENWGDGEPNISNGHCAVIDGTTGIWSAQNCDDDKRYLCEKNTLESHNWFVIGEKMYLVTQRRRTFEEAVNYCSMFGSTLAVIQHEEENLKVIKAALSNARHLSDSRYNTAYIGYHRKTKSERSWGWIESTEKSLYTNFSMDASFDESKSCAVLKTDDGSWEPISCDLDHHFICEKDVQWHYINGKRIALIRRSGRYNEHEETCSGMNAKILEIESEEENSFVLQVVDDETPEAYEYMMNFRYLPENTTWYRDKNYEVQIPYEYFLNNGNRFPTNTNTNYSAMLTYSGNRDRGKWIARPYTTRSLLTCFSQQQHREVSWNGKTYSILESHMDKVNAEKRCTELGLQLVSIDSLREAIFVAKSIKRSHKGSYTFWINHIEPAIAKNFVRTTFEQGISWSDLRLSAQLNDYCIDMVLRKKMSLSYSSCTRLRAVVCETQESTHSSFEKSTESKAGTIIEHIASSRGLAFCSSSCTRDNECLAFNYFPANKECELINSLQDTNDARNGLQQYLLRQT